MNDISKKQNEQCPNFGQQTEAATIGPGGEHDLMNAKQVARMLACSERTVWRLRSSGDIPEPVHFGGLTRWTRVSLTEWIESGCKQRSA